MLRPTTEDLTRYLALETQIVSLRVKLAALEAEHAEIKDRIETELEDYGIRQMVLVDKQGFPIGKATVTRGDPIVAWEKAYRHVNGDAAARREIAYAPRATILTLESYGPFPLRPDTTDDASGRTAQPG